MVIMPESGANLERDQFKSAMYTLHHLLIDQILKPVDKFVPKFKGKPLHIRGSIRLWCENEETVTWLERTVGQMRETWPGPTLKVVRECDMPNLIRCSLVIPHKVTTLDNIRNMLAKQNQWAECHSWKHYHTRIFRNQTDIMFGIPEPIVRKILEKERRLSYMFGSVYIKFFNSDNTLSDYPPDHNKPANSNSTTTSKTEEASRDKAEINNNS
ncbi:uncharacterized protein LOC114354315 [Ostrinia furnacalis]|uniref:uncharacterized protein LOC114354315 n=1 Tax=Ostrinia furnacalis TaxID=93504 RepID=UPI00103B8307|nr:uncharacterized protein LOC114354315 [Ostrinia furnacalis]